MGAQWLEANPAALVSPVASIRYCRSDARCGLAEESLPLRGKLHRGEKILNAVVRKRAVDHAKLSPCLIQPPGKRQAIGGDRLNVRVRVRAGGGFDGPFGSLVEPAEAHKGHRTGAEHREKQRIKWAETPRVIREPDGRDGITALAVNEGEV